MRLCCWFAFWGVQQTLLCQSKVGERPDQAREDRYLVNSRAEPMARDELREVVGNLHPGSVGRRQLCLGRERREGGLLMPETSSTRRSKAVPALPPVPEQLRTETGGEVPRGQTRAQQSWPWSHARSRDRRGAERSPLPERGGFRLWWAAGTRCCCHPLRNSQRLWERGPGASQHWRVAAEGGTARSSHGTASTKTGKKSQGFEAVGLGSAGFGGQWGGHIPCTPTGWVLRDGHSGPALGQLWGPQQVTERQTEPVRPGVGRVLGWEQRAQR